MTTVSHPQAVTEAGAGTWWHGRSGLIIPAVLGAFMTYLLVGQFTMRVTATADFPGPKFFPALIIVAGYIVTVMLVVHYVRHPEPAEAPSYSEYDDVSDTAREEAAAAAAVRYRFFSDWKAVGWAVLGFAVFAVAILPVGWILSAAFLVWCVARSMGSTKPALDVVVALTMSSLAYLAFDVGLGLSLPSGVLGGW